MPGGAWTELSLFRGDEFAAVGLNDWALAGIGAQEAGRWTAAGFPNPTQALEWRDRGFLPISDSVATATQWRQAGFEPAAAAAWRTTIPNPTNAATWRKNRFAPTEALTWRRAGWTPRSPRRIQLLHPHDGVWCGNARRWRDAGFEAADASKYVAAGDYDPEGREISFGLDEVSRWRDVGILTTPDDLYKVTNWEHLGCTTAASAGRWVQAGISDPFDAARLGSVGVTADMLNPDDWAYTTPTDNSGQWVHIAVFPDRKVAVGIPSPTSFPPPVDRVTFRDLVPAEIVTVAADLDRDALLDHLRMNATLTAWKDRSR